MSADPGIMSRRTALALNACILLAYGAIAIVARPWAAFAGFLALGTLIRITTYLWKALRDRRHNEQKLDIGLLLSLLIPPVIAGFIYVSLFLALWWIGDYWKVIGVVVCGVVIYVSLLPIPPKTPADHG
jgi:ABC-type molybdate transport system permease subunit